MSALACSAELDRHLLKRAEHLSELRMLLVVMDLVRFVLATRSPQTLGVTELIRAPILGGRFKTDLSKINGIHLSNYSYQYRRNSIRVFKSTH